MIGLALVCLYLTSLQTTFARNLSSYHEECPLWNSQDKNGNCSCSKSMMHTVICESLNGVNTVYLRDCYCMTLGPLGQQPVVGSCIYTCFRQFIENNGENLEVNLKSKYSSEVTNETCGSFNRQGVLCSRCSEGYGLPIYSYNVSCVPCRKYKYNWLKYLAAVYPPLTVFVFIVIVLKISVNSGSLIAYVTLIQMLYSRYVMWNLEFSRPFTSDLCLHPNLSPLQILVLEYAVALYPMILVLLTSFIVYWHGKSHIVVLFCRPLYTLLHRFRKMWNVKTSLIEAFATLILLSYVDIISISLDIICYNKYSFMNESNTKFVFADPSVEHMSKEHLPYFILAITSIILFNIVPLLLLCFYPCRCFHKVVDYCGLNGRILNSFVDAFRGSYKLKPDFLQSFTAVYLMSNFCSNILCHVISNLLYHSALTYVLITLLVIVALLRPHKNKWHNRINALLIFAAFLINSTENNKLVRKFLFRNDIQNWDFFNRSAESMGLVFFLLYFICLVFKSLLQDKITSCIKRYRLLKMFWKKTSESTPMDSSYPYRFQESDTNQRQTPKDDI